VAVDLGGAELTAEADLSIPALGAPTDHLIVSRILRLGTSNRLVLADTASLGVDGSIHTNSPPFPGVRVGGSFLFMQMPSTLGILGVDVRRADGSPVKGAIVSSFVTKINPGTALASIEATIASEGLFVGESDGTGFAAMPTATGNTSVALVASASNQLTNTTMIGITGVNLPNLPTPPLPLINRGIDVIIEHTFQNVHPPDQPEPCDCNVLSVSPSQITAPDFVTGKTVSLTVFCGFQNVTLSDSMFSLSSVLDSLLKGTISNFTAYISTNDAIASVSQSGVVTAVAPGQTSIHILHYSLKAETVDNIIFFHQCTSEGQVYPVTVSGKLSVSLNGTGSGTVQSGGQEIICPTTCSATFPPAAAVPLIATPASGSVFTSWGGDCNGTSATTSVLLTVDRSCTATFTSSVPTIFVVVHGDHGLGCCNNNLYDLRPGGNSVFAQQGETIRATFGQKTFSVQYHVFEDGATTDGEGGNIDVYVIGPPGTPFHLDYTFVQSASASNQSTGGYLSGVIMQGLADLSIFVQPGFSNQKSISGGSAIDGVTTSQAVAFLDQTYSLAWSAGHLIEVGANTCCGSYTGHAEADLVVNLTVR